MSNLFLDVTELSNWQGPVTGVPRVIYELSVRFQSQENVVFVRWDAVTRNFLEVENGEIVIKPLTQVQGAPNLQTSKVKKLILSNMISKKVAVTGKKVLRKALNVSKRVTVNKANITEGDMLFILSDWHSSDPRFISELERLCNNGVKLASICYDLLPLVTPQYSGHITKPLERFTKQIYPLCEVLFSISKNTKRDVINWLQENNLPIPKIEVVRLGDDFKKSTRGDLSSRIKKLENTRFILCIGTIEARKNHTLLYYAYKLASAKNINLPRLVIVGRKGWRTDDIFEIMSTDPEIQDQLLFIHSATDSELPWLYTNCSFTIYPSFYEGWGLPIAESLSYGTPCIASNTSSMPEIAGDLIEYFSPSSTDECLAAIQKLLNPRNLQAARSKVKKYKMTTWDETFDFINEHIGAIYGKN